MFKPFYGPEHQYLEAVRAIQNFERRYRPIPKPKTEESRNA